MALRAMIIDQTSDPRWQDAFVRYVPQVFPRASFRLAHELGGWADGYRAFVAIDGDEIVANASVQRMSVILQGREIRGLQLGAVGVIPSWRGKGLQREIMPRVLASAADDELMFLFANDSVLEFYPRYGFRRVVEHVFGADHRVHPDSTDVRKLSLTNAEDRTLLARVAATAQPVTEMFGARDYGSVLLWYWANYYQNDFFYAPEDEAIIVAEQENDVLRICDVQCAHPLDLARHLPGLISQPVNRIEFCFTPERMWPQAKPTLPYTDSPLFVRGEFAFPSVPFKYPLLAQT